VLIARTLHLDRHETAVRIVGGAGRGAGAWAAVCRPATRAKENQLDCAGFDWSVFGADIVAGILGACSRISSS
jgi:hypothetical protein